MRSRLTESSECAPELAVIGRILPNRKYKSFAPLPRIVAVFSGSHVIKLNKKALVLQCRFSLTCR